MASKMALTALDAINKFKLFEKNFTATAERI